MKRTDGCVDHECCSIKGIYLHEVIMPPGGVLQVGDVVARVGKHDNMYLQPITRREAYALLRRRGIVHNCKEHLDMIIQDRAEYQKLRTEGAV